MTDPEDIFIAKHKNDRGHTVRDVRWDKIRGSFVKFARESEEIWGRQETPNADEVYLRWLEYMNDNLGGSFTILIGKRIEKERVKEEMRDLYGEEGVFYDFLQEKWEHREETEDEEQEDDQPAEVERKTQDKWNQFEKESKEEHGGDNSEPDSSDESEETEITSGRLGEWSDKHGTTDEVNTGTTTTDTDSKSENVSTTGVRFSSVRSSEAEVEDLEDIRNKVLLGNVYEVLDQIPSNSVHSIVTSPPYWNLRDYEDADGALVGGDPDCDHTFVGNNCRECEGWKGQLGNEDTPDQYVANMMAIISKLRRILRPDGSFWLNIGETYAGTSHSDSLGTTRKSVCMIPERVYMEMIREGWVARNKTVWAKQIMRHDNSVEGATNPTSVKDRINNTWEPFWWFTNEPDYYSDIFAVRREHQTEAVDEEEIKEKYGGKYGSDKIEDENINSPTARAAREGYTPSLRHEAGANIPDVWRIKTGSTQELHTAVFSPEIVTRPIQASTPKTTCAECGKPYERDTDEGEHVGWKKMCHCKTEETKPGIVFEPFTGRGTTPKTALDNGFDYIGTEISEEYLEVAEGYIPDTRQMGLNQSWGD